MPNNWSGGIEELVEEANLRLAQVLPAERAARPKDEVNARLVRHYTTQGLLPAPWREGREARYGRPHLLQLLALRRLMADGLSGKALYAALEDKNTEQLTELTELGSTTLGGLMSQQSLNLQPTDSQVADSQMAGSQMEAANPALRYLQSLKRRDAPAPVPAALVPAALAAAPLRSGTFEAASSIPVAAPKSAPALPAAVPPAQIKQIRDQRVFRQVEVAPGLDLQVTSHFVWPQDEPEWQRIWQEVRSVLEELQRDSSC